MIIDIHFQMDELEVAKADEMISLMGFKSRAVYLRLLMYLTAYGAAAAEHDPNLDPATVAWVERLKENASEDQKIEAAIMGVIRELAHPVIAMRGMKAAKRCSEDIRNRVFEETGRYLSPEAIDTALNAYAAYYKVELDNYRQNIANERYAELLKEKEETEEFLKGNQNEKHN